MGITAEELQKMKFIVNTAQIAARLEIIRKLFASVIIFFKKCFDVFKDGVQLTDAFSFPSLASAFGDIYKSFPEAWKEKDNLSGAEIKTLTKEFSESIIDVFGIQGAKTKVYKISSTVSVMTNIIETIKIVKKALADGLQLSDIKSIPSIIGCIVTAIWEAPTMVLELKELDGEEISMLSGEMAFNIFQLIKY